MTNSPLEQAVNLIKRSQKILLLSSSPPDGDSLGSALALYLFLKKYDPQKEITAVCADPVPDVYKFLPQDEVIKDEFNASRDFIVTLESPKAEVKNIDYKIENNKVNIVITPRRGQYTEKNVTFSHGETKYDLVVVLDAGDLEQLGDLYEDHIDFFFAVPVINLDHHASNTNFGQVNLVDITASSTTEILYAALKELDQGKGLIDENIATALLAGVITDTGSFQNANTTPKALAISAELVNLGARQQEIIKHVYKTKNLSTLKLWGRVLTKIKNDSQHRLVWSLITQQDLQETESLPEETGNIIDELMTNTPNAEVILLLKEKKPGLVKGSLRTTTASCDASKIAEGFGGGGHIQAAGFKIEGKSLEEAEKLVIKKIKKYQAERLHIVPETNEISAAPQATASEPTPAQPVSPEPPVQSEPLAAEKPAIVPPTAPLEPTVPKTESSVFGAEPAPTETSSPGPKPTSTGPDISNDELVKKFFNAEKQEEPASPKKPAASPQLASSAETPAQPELEPEFKPKSVPTPPAAPTTTEEKSVNEILSNAVKSDESPATPYQFDTEPPKTESPQNSSGSPKEPPQFEDPLV